MNTPVLIAYFVIPALITGVAWIGVKLHERRVRRLDAELRRHRSTP